MKSNEIVAGILLGYIIYRCGELLTPWVKKRLLQGQKIYRPVTGHKKRALLVGCNYPGTKAQLSGCHNDVRQQKALLKDIYGFTDDDITVLIDGTAAASKQPTRKNIMRELRNLGKRSNAGDIVFVHFSGHGVQIPTDDPEEEDYLDEALVCTDMNLIIDDDLRDIVKCMDTGVKFTLVADCCHSGNMLDGPPAIIKGDKTRDLQLSGVKHQISNKREISAQKVKKREITIDQYQEILAGQENVGQKTRSLVASKFGEDSPQRLREQKFSQQYQTKQQAIGKRVKSEAVLKKELLEEDIGILITGCQDFETSADATMGGRAFGAMTNGLVTIVRQHYRLYPDQEITYMELVLQLRHLLAVQGYAQNPCLECTPANAQRAYLLVE